MCNLILIIIILLTQPLDTPEVKLNDQASIIETITKPDPTVVSQTEKADIPSEDPHKAKVIQENSNCYVFDKA